MRIAFHAAADREAEEVADYYDRQLPGLGAEFYHELGTMLDLLIRSLFALGATKRDLARAIAVSKPTREGHAKAA
ncbi:MAG: hypothetical protein EPN55_03490 [Gammaproteobacteria bacterium]|nr:MAG: hypothetical protein EPN55_03490 [Gammaproteobacteria bacterium]